MTDNNPTFIDNYIAKFFNKRLLHSIADAVELINRNDYTN